MKVHTTNYFDAFILVADDCPAGRGEKPPVKGDKRTVANMQFEMVKNNPYKYTSDEVLFQVYADKKDLTSDEYEAEREKFFSRGQACFRASPLAKRYGWGVHSNKEGKIAIYGRDTEMYQKLANDKGVTVVKAMRTSR